MAIRLFYSAGYAARPGEPGFRHAGVRGVQLEMPRRHAIFPFEKFAELADVIKTKRCCYVPDGPVRCADCGISHFQLDVEPEPIPQSIIRLPGKE
jgi:hypothetical protein